MQTTGTIKFTDRTDPSVISSWIAMADEIPQTTHRRFLTAVWSGQTMLQARTYYGLSHEQAKGILAKNILEIDPRNQLLSEQK